MSCRVDGIGLAGYFRHPEDLEPAVAAGIRCVLLGGSTVLPGVDIVRSDDRGGGAQATSYLIERGYRRIGFVTGPPGESPSAERVSGYQKSLSDHGHEVQPDLIVRPGFDRRAGARGLAELLDLPERLMQ